MLAMWERRSPHNTAGGAAGGTSQIVEREKDNSRRKSQRKNRDAGANSHPFYLLRIGDWKLVLQLCGKQNKELKAK
jgi:hypothetical protein